MPIVSSYADIIRDWEGLLEAGRENLATYPSLGEYVTGLQTHLDETKALKALQDSAADAKQRSTQELKAKLTEGRAKAIRVRGAAKAALGHKNEGLVRFGVAPTRKRTRRVKPVEGPSLENTGQPTPSTKSDPTT